jgi:hypothetical protein
MSRSTNVSRIACGSWMCTVHHQRIDRHPQHADAARARRTRQHGLSWRGPCHHANAQEGRGSMDRRQIDLGHGQRLLLLDSITQLEPTDAGAYVVAGSHGGASSGEVACGLPLAAVVFNDAGIGKDEAGVVALGMLQRRGVPALAVAHTSARIGDALDAWEHGVVSRLNEAARAQGWGVGETLQAALRRWSR